VVSLLKIFERFHIPFPIKAEQVLRLNENKDFSYEEAEMDFGFSPLPFQEGITLELKSIQAQATISKMPRSEHDT
jgi:hypothetical protein